MIIHCKKLKSLLKYLFFCLTSTLFLWQCASIQSPSGGPKDLEAPTVIYSYPTHGETNSSPKKIEITFDEFIVLKNLTNELFVSPPLNNKPIINQKGKSLFIQLKEELNANSTYTFNFGKGIADLNEGNVLENYSLVFSTGAEIDSARLNGMIHPCPDRKLPDNLLVGAYKKNNFNRDSTIFQKRPNYISIPDQYGYFEMKQMRTGNYELIAFEDVNGDYLYSGSPERIAFSEELIQLNDSLTKNLWLFQEEEKELKIVDGNFDGNQLKWVCNKNIESFEIKMVPEVDFFSKIDSNNLLIWPVFGTTDSLQVTVAIEGQTDTMMVYEKTDKKGSIGIIAPSNEYLKKGSNYTLATSSPILRVERSKMKLLIDTTAIDFLTLENTFELDLEFDVEENKKYQIIFEPGALVGPNNMVNDSSKISFFTKEENTLANLKINLQTSSEAYFIEILKDGNVLERCEPSKNLYFKNLLPGPYELRLVIDSNKDGKWTPGDYFTNTLPEKVYYYLKPLDLRANWELEIDWEL